MILLVMLRSRSEWRGAARAGGTGFLGEVAEVDSCIDFDADMALCL